MDRNALFQGRGAEGIGLCRTEHMFFASERILAFRRMILAKDEAGRQAALDDLLPYQRQDFVGIYRAMDGLPVTIRLLDPPLHEFLPKRENLTRQIAELTLRKVRERKKVEKLENVLARVEQLHEFNPMLGHRGTRSIVAEEEGFINTLYDYIHGSYPG